MQKNFAQIWVHKRRPITSSIAKLTVIDVQLKGQLAEQVTSNIS